MTVNLRLPFFSNGELVQVTQFPGGSFSHTGFLFNAWDFALPVGTDVLAAADGVVVDIRETIPDGGPTSLSVDSSWGSGSIGNIVTLRHEQDGEVFYSSYFHLRENSVTVKIGDIVLAGQAIAQVGNTGFRDGTHLHIQVGDDTVLFGATNNGYPDGTDEGDPQIVADASDPFTVDWADFGTDLPDEVIGQAPPVLAASEIYVSDENAILYSIDPINLSARVIGQMSVVMTDLAFGPDGTLYGISFTDLYEIDPGTGASSLIGGWGFDGMNALVINEDGDAFAANTINTNLYAIDLETGQSTFIGNTGFFSSGDLSFVEGDLFMTTQSGLLVTISEDTGEALGSVDIGLTDMFGLGQLNSTLYGFAGTLFYEVNRDTGALIPLGNVTEANAFFGAASTDIFAEASVDVDRTGTDDTDFLFGTAGNDTLFGFGGPDLFFGRAGNDLIDGGSNVDFAFVAGESTSYSVVQTSIGVFEVSGPDGTDTLRTIEFLQFDNGILRLLPGTGVAVNFETADPAVYQDAMNAILDFDGNALGGNGAWLRIGEADVNGDGDIDQLLVNDAIGRFATVGTAPDGLVYFNDNSWAGETRVAGIYIDPLVEAGIVERFSPNDSQQRFQNDLSIENINQVLGADDYDGDGLQDIYFALTDGTAYLRAIMEFDGNISYANYQSEEQVIEFLNANGFGEETYGDWFGGSGSEAASGMAAEALPAMAINPLDMFQAEVFG